MKNSAADNYSRMKCNIVNVKEKNSPEFSSLMADG